MHSGTTIGLKYCSASAKNIFIWHPVLVLSTILQSFLVSKKLNKVCRTTEAQANNSKKSLKIQNSPPIQGILKSEIAFFIEF